MTPVWVDDLGVGDGPVPYAIAQRLVTSTEAAALAGRTVESMARAAAAGDCPAVKFSRSWMFELDSLLSYAARASRGRVVWLVSAPLLHAIDERGGPAKVGVRHHSPEQKAIGRARRSGRITIRQADHLAVTLLGLTPLEVWGSEYLSA